MSHLAPPDNARKDSRPLISVVMPAYNEQDSLEDTVREVAAQLADLEYEIIIVDDGSTDGTWEVITQLSAPDGRIRGLRFSRNFGQQPALLAGLAAARGDAVITLDSDGQHPPGLIPEMVERWQQGTTVVQGLRADRGQTGVTKDASSRGFYRFFSWISNTPIPSGAADYRLLDRKAVELAISNPRPALFLRGFVPWTGFRSEFIRFAPRARRAGRSKYSLGRKLGFARQGVLRFSIKPLRLATLLGGICCVGSLGYLLYVLVIRLLVGGALPGWASVAGLLALLGGVQLLMLGILGEYVGMIYEALQDKPMYIVEESTDDPVLQ